MAIFFRTAIIALLALVSGVVMAAPATFDRAKELMRNEVYHDQAQRGAMGTLYCGCDWRWVGKSGGRVDHDSCGYEMRSTSAAAASRAARIEWEHIMPASHFGSARQCWQNGGRSNCTRTDPVFSAMEADMHNLSPTVGEVNGDRSNYSFGAIAGPPSQYGACPSKVDFKNRTFEPRDEAKGLVARVMFYMHDHYGLRMSESQQRLLMAWDKQFPPTAWEVERDRRIARIMGHHNPFVTGEAQWTLGHKNSRAGIVSPLPARSEHATARVAPTAARAPASSGAPVHGNKNSGVYHLPVGCPSYNAMAERNRVVFGSEAEAVAAGYRKAGNCR